MEQKRTYKCPICKTEDRDYKGVCFNCLYSKDLEIREKVKNHKIKLEQKRKYYNTGIKVKSLNEFFESEVQWFYWFGDRITHKSVLINQQARFLFTEISQGRIKYAKLKNELGEEK